MENWHDRKMESAVHSGERLRSLEIRLIEYLFAYKRNGNVEEIIQKEKLIKEKKKAAGN